MTLRHWMCGIAAAVCVATGVPASRTMAKPPDLPIDQRVRCPEIEEEAPAPQSSCPVELGSRSAASQGREVGRTCHQDAEGQGTCTRDQSNRPVSQARAWFYFAERCRQTGDVEQARTAYQETHLLSPESRLGRQAIRRLSEMDAEQSGANEEQEPPLLRRPRRETPEESRHREMLRDTEPLGSSPLVLNSGGRSWNFQGKRQVGSADLIIVRP